MTKMFTNHRERFQQNKHRADPSKPPPTYDDCLSVLDFRSRKRKDKSKPPGTLNVSTKPRPVHSKMMTTFSIGDSTPPLESPQPQFHPHPPSLLGPPNPPRDHLITTLATILLEAVALAWGSDEEDDERVEEEDLIVVARDETPVAAEPNKSNETNRAQPPQSTTPVVKTSALKRLHSEIQSPDDVADPDSHLGKRRPGRRRPLVDELSSAQNQGGFTPINAGGMKTKGKMNDTIVVSRPTKNESSTPSSANGTYSRFRAYKPKAGA